MGIDDGQAASTPTAPVVHLHSRDGVLPTGARRPVILMVYSIPVIVSFQVVNAYNSTYLYK